MTPRIACLLACLLGCLAAGEPPAEMRRVREMAGQEKHRDEAVAMCRRIADDDKRPAEERARAARLVPVLLVGAGKAAEAKAEAARLAAAAPGQRAVAGTAELVDALILANEGRRDDAVAALRKLSTDADASVKARAGMHLAALLSRGEKNKPAPAEVQAQVLAIAEAAAAAADDAWDARESLRLAREAADRARDLAGQERALRAWLRDPVAAIIEPRERDETTNRLGRVLQDGKRFDEARALYGAELAKAEAALAALRAEGDAVEQRQYNDRNNQAVGGIVRWNLEICMAWRNQGDKAQAIAAADAVFNAAADPGYEMQVAGNTVVECLADRPDEALSAARTMYEAVGGGDGLKTLARLLAKGDGKQEKEISAWLEHGSAGPDGATGTADDLPARQLPAQRATYPKRAAIARTIPLTSGYNARRRANLLLYAGEPAEAAAVVRWWIGQARSAAEAGAVAEVLSRCAVALANDPAAKRRAFRWIADGPMGPDGQKGTADDLADPIPGIAATSPPAPAGGDAALLRRLRAAAARLCSDDRAQGGVRGNALGTVLRIDMLFSTRPSPDELLSWYDGNPGGIMDLLAADIFARDTHLGALPEVQRQLDTLGFDKQPDWIKGKRKSWPEVQAELRQGKASKAWW